MKEILVEEIMTNEVVTCGPDEPLIDVVKQLAIRKFSCFVIVDNKIPVGIITERDLVELLIDALEGVTWDELAIKNFMSSPIITVTEDMTLDQIMELSHKSKIRHIPVVNSHGEIVGILTQTNIIAGCYKNL